MYLLETVTSPDFSGLINALQTAITPAQILTILTSVVGVGIAFVLMWLGVRKIAGAFISAVQDGTFRI